MYRVFSTSLFRNALVSKAAAAASFLCSCCLLPLRNYRSLFRLNLADIFRGDQLWHLLLFRLPFLDLKDVIGGTILIYLFRVVERRLGSRQFSTFLIIVNMLNFILEFTSFSLLSLYQFDVQYIPSGPYSMLATCFVIFINDFPSIEMARAWGLTITSRTFVYLLCFQLFMSSPLILVSCLCGMVTGFLIRNNLNFFGEISTYIFPSVVTELCSSTLGRIVNLAEDKKGQILPIGATVELQRQDLYDRIEQRLIMQQMRMQHQQDQNAGQGFGLATARRLFDTFSATTAANQRVAPSEEKIQTLVDMGLGSRQNVSDALEQVDNDLNSAITVLLNNPR